MKRHVIDRKQLPVRAPVQMTLFSILFYIQFPQFKFIWGAVALVNIVAWVVWVNLFLGEKPVKVSLRGDKGD